eukprot:gene17023-22529_t
MSSTERKLVGFHNFKRHNPLSDRFPIKRFHSLEFYCSDSTNISKRFTWGLGMHEVARSDLSTGNKHYSSICLQSNDLIFVFTSSYNNPDLNNSFLPYPSFSQSEAHKFVIDHGLAVKAVCLVVEDSTEAYNISTINGAIGKLSPTTLIDRKTNEVSVISEIQLFGDTVIRWISGNYSGPYLPNYELVSTPDINYGIKRLDHCVCNVPKLFPAIDYLMNSVGFHEFSEFTADDVGTIDSGLNSMVLANNSEFVLIPINEPTFGTKRKSQIQSYLEHNNGSGVQHLALLTTNIFHTMRELRNRSLIGGFEFMPKPGADYYSKVSKRIGEDILSKEQLIELEELGLLADKDDQGVLLQVFTKPIGDRPTIFIEIIQRIGCDKSASGESKEQAAGCGGFGKGNFSELFKSIEEFEKLQEAAASNNLK